jgi:hypothetical protein
MEIFPFIIIIFVALIFMSIAGWGGKLFEIILGVFSGGVGNCMGCILKVIFAAIVISIIAILL